MDNKQNKIDTKTILYGIAFVIAICVLVYMFTSKSSTENYYIDKASKSMHEYDSKANFDISATVIDNLNQVMVKFTPSDTYTTNKYGDFYVEYNSKSKNVIRTSAYNISLNVFQ